MIVESLSNKLTEKNRPLFERITGLFPEAFIAGGSARQIYLDEDFGSTDIDLYFKEYSAIGRASERFAEYTIETSKSLSFIVAGSKVQIIKKPAFVRGDPSLFDTYDFTCCMFAITKERDQWLIHATPQAIVDAKGKWLVVSNPGTPGGSLDKRIGKYLKKGYFPKCKTSMAIYQDFLKFAERLYNDEFFVSDNPAQAIFDGYFGNTEDIY